MPMKPEDFPDRFPEDAFIQQSIDPNSVVTCPYNAAHVVSAKRFPLHLQRCRKHHGDMGIELRTCPFNALHDVDESVYYDHLCNCPDRKLLDAALVVRTDETPTVQYMLFDLKGDLTVPDYDNETIAEEVWSDHSAVVAPRQNYSSMRDDAGRRYDRALARLLEADPSLLNIPAIRKRKEKMEREPRPIVYVENIINEQEIRKAKRKERRKRIEEEKQREKEERKKAKEEKLLEKEERKKVKEELRREKDRRRAKEKEERGKSREMLREREEEKGNSETLETVHDRKRREGDEGKTSGKEKKYKKAHDRVKHSGMEREKAKTEEAALPDGATQPTEELLTLASQKLEKLKKSKVGSPRRKSSSSPKKKKKNKTSRPPPKIQVPSYSAIRESPFLSTAYRMGLVEVKESRGDGTSLRRRSPKVDVANDAGAENQTTRYPKVDVVNNAGANDQTTRSPKVDDVGANDRTDGNPDDVFEGAKSEVPPLVAIEPIRVEEDPLPVDSLLALSPSVVSSWRSRFNCGVSAAPDPFGLSTFHDLRPFAAQQTREPFLNSRAKTARDASAPGASASRLSVASDDPFGLSLCNGVNENVNPRRDDADRNGVAVIPDAARRRFLVDHGLPVEDEKSKELADTFELLRFEIRDRRLERLRPE